MSLIFKTLLTVTGIFAGNLLFAEVCGPAFSVEKINGVPRISMDGKAVTPRLLAGNFLLGQGRKRELVPGCAEQIRYAADSGIVIVSAQMRPVYKDVPGTVENLLDSCKKILEIDDRIYLLPRFSMTTGMGDVPQWALQHDKLNLAENGEAIVDNWQKHPSVDDPEFRAAMVQALSDTIDVMEKHFGDRIAGYHVGGLKVAEWQYLMFHDTLSGYDPGTLEMFRRFLRKKYGSDRKLAAAWNTPDATFDTVTVPTGKERVGVSGRIFHDPATEQKAIDFAEFRSQDIVDLIGELAAVVRKKCGRKRLFVTFYGYIFECAAVSKYGPHEAGHCALGELLKNPDVDILVGPYSYMGVSRPLGGSPAIHTAGESVTAAGKIWLNEDDVSTPIASARKEWSDGPGKQGRSWEEVEKVHQAHLGSTYARNYALWWFDLHGTAWFAHKPMWDAIGRMAQIEKDITASPVPFMPDVIMSVDENSLKYANSSEACNRVFGGSAMVIRDWMSRASVNFGSFLLSDILSGNVQAAKLEVHPTAIVLTAEQRKFLRERSKKTATVWMTAPGYIDPEKRMFSLDAIREVSGFSVYRDPSITSFKMKSTAEARKLIPDLPEYFGSGEALDPVFAVKLQTGDVVLAEYESTKLPAVVYRPRRPGMAPALFIGGNALPQSLIRFMAVKGGAHVYCNKDLHISDNQQLLCVTAPEDGMYRLDTGRNKVWQDVLSGETFSRRKILDLKMQKGETLYLKVVE